MPARDLRAGPKSAPEGSPGEQVIEPLDPRRLAVWLVVLFGALPLVREEREARETEDERQATPIGAPSVG